MKLHLSINTYILFIFFFPLMNYDRDEIIYITLLHFSVPRTSPSYVCIYVW